MICILQERAGNMYWRRRWIVGLILFLFIVHVPAMAQSWEPMPIVSQAMLNSGISPGGEGAQVIRGITASTLDPNFVMVATDVGGIYRSLDGGARWQVTMSGWNARGGNGFAIDPRNANRVIGIGANSMDYGSSNGLYLSTNKGASWTQSLQAATGFQGDIEYDKSSYNSSLGYCTVAYYTGSTGLWKSTNGGSSWTKIRDGFYNCPIEVHPVNGYLYVASAGDDHGFWRSSDGGANFTQYTTDYVTGLDVIETQPDNVYISRWFKVWKSTDSGVTFNYVGDNYYNDGLPDNTPLYGLLVSPSNPDYMLVYYDAGNWNWPKYYTHNGGKTWQTATINTTNSFLPVNARSPMWSWHSTNANIIYNNGGDIITKSTDGGQNFNWASNGENAVMVGGKLNISPTSPGTVLLSFQDYNAGVTTNGGSSWTYANPSGNGWGGYCYGGYAVDGNVMWLGNAQSWGGTRELKVSRDGGSTWQLMTSGGNTITFSGPDIGYSDPNNSNNCFASNWRSTDKGLTWTAMTGCDGVFTSSPSGSKELIGKKGNNIVKSTNGGASWTTVATITGGFEDVAYDHVRNRYYVASEDQLKKVEGGTVSVLATPADQYGTVRVATVAVDPQDPAIVYAGNHRDIYACSNAVVRTTDAGATWQNLTVGGTLAWEASGGPHEVMSIRVHPTTRYAWVSGQCYGMWKIGPPNGGTLNGLYKITAKHSGKVLDVASASTLDGGDVHQWEYVGATNQQWNVTPVSGGYYKITANHSGKALDVQDFSTADGGNIQQWSFGNSDNQLWQIQSVEPGYYRIVSKLSGKSVDVSAGSTANGANVVQWAAHGGDNQRWSFQLLTGARMAASEVKSAEILEDMTIFPNPSNGLITIRCATPLVEVVVYDLLGKEQISKTVAGENEVSLTITHLPKGPFVVKGKTITGGTVSGKFIVQ